MLTPVSGHGDSSGSKSMMVARREWLRAAASATFITNAWSIPQTYSSRRASGGGALLRSSAGASRKVRPCRKAPASVRKAPGWAGKAAARRVLAAAGYAAVERDDRAGQIGACAGCEQQRQADHVVGPADAPQRHQLLDVATAVGLIEPERR